MGNKTLSEKANLLLDVWIKSEDGSGQFKYTGYYWEVLHPILLKYCPEKLQQYEGILGYKFDYFDADVKEIVDSGSDEENYKNALDYMNWRIGSFAGVNDLHTLDMGDDEIIYYMPNQCI